jgi:hypothetical protein
VGHLADYPFIPKSNAYLEPGQFRAIPLSDGRFACGRVLAIDREPEYGRRTMFVAGLLDWVGEEPSTAESLASAPQLDAGHAHIETIRSGDGTILGQRDLELDGLTVSRYWGTDFPRIRAERASSQAIRLRSQSDACSPRR